MAEGPHFPGGKPVKVADGEIITTPERAEQLGLTADARRMREGPHPMRQGLTKAEARAVAESTLSRPLRPERYDRIRDLIAGAKARLRWR